MCSSQKWGFLGAALVTTGLVFSAQGSSQAQSLSQTVLASNYDPYTLGWTACPQGAPEGGPKCEKLLPRSHPRLG
jgi:hypothetical protein